MFDNDNNNNDDPTFTPEQFGAVPMPPPPRRSKRPKLDQRATPNGNALTTDDVKADLFEQTSSWAQRQELPATAKDVLGKLQQVIRRGLKRWPTQSQIARDLGTTDRTVRRSVALLAELGYIEVIDNRRRSLPNGYRLLDTAERHELSRPTGHVNPTTGQSMVTTGQNVLTHRTKCPEPHRTFCPLPLDLSDLDLSKKEHEEREEVEELEESRANAQSHSPQSFPSGNVNECELRYAQPQEGAADTALESKACCASPHTFAAEPHPDSSPSSASPPSQTFSESISSRLPNESGRGATKPRRTRQPRANRKPRNDLRDPAKLLEPVVTAVAQKWRRTMSDRYGQQVPEITLHELDGLRVLLARECGITSKTFDIDVPRVDRVVRETKTALMHMIALWPEFSAYCRESANLYKIKEHDPHLPNLAPPTLSFFVRYFSVILPVSRVLTPAAIVLTPAAIELSQDPDARFLYTANEAILVTINCQLRDLEWTRELT